MNHQPTPNAPETPQKATGGPQGASEGPSGQRETPEGQNRPQAGTDGLGFRKQITAAIRDTPARYPDDIATAVWRVVAREIERMKVRVAASESDAHAVRMAAQYADKAIENGERAKRAEAAIARVRKVIAERRTEVAERETDGMLPFGTPGASWCDAVTVTCDRIDDALRIHPDPLGIPCPPAHNAGPSVRECAAQDAAHWNDKYAGEER